MWSFPWLWSDRNSDIHIVDGVGWRSGYIQLVWQHTNWIQMHRRHLPYIFRWLIYDATMFDPCDVYFDLNLCNHYRLCASVWCIGMWFWPLFEEKKSKWAQEVLVTTPWLLICSLLLTLFVVFLLFIYFWVLFSMIFNSSRGQIIHGCRFIEMLN